MSRYFGNRKQLIKFAIPHFRLVVGVLAFAILVLSESSCMKEFEINQKDFPPILVVNGIVNQGNSFIINVSRTAGINEQFSLMDLFIEDAVVKLYEGETYLETMQHDSAGYYRSLALAEANKSYKIVVEKDLFKTATAHFDFFEVSGISIIDFEMSASDSIYQYDRPEPGEISLFQVRTNYKVKIIDNGEEKNYYSVIMLENLQEISRTSIWYDDDIHEEFIELSELRYGQLNANLEFIPENDMYRQSRIEIGGYNFRTTRYDAIKDDCFSGQTAVLPYISSYKTPELKDIEIRIFSIPESLVKYYESIDLYSNTYDNPYSEPVNVLSNIENGIGFSCGIPHTSFIISTNKQ